MILWTETLQCRLNEDPSAPIFAISLHPGGVDTFSPKSKFPRIVAWLSSLLIANTEVGAYNSVFAAAWKKVQNNRKTYEGAYLQSQPTGMISVPIPKALDDDLGDKLWDLTSRFLKDIGVDVEA